ncbi:MAG: transcriptional repressor [Chloroflexi bacterium]|nr:transcriptional repressor [Chloroflexota bacterium]
MSQPQSARQMTAALKQHGCRMTPQRQLILNALGSFPGHVSAEAIHQQVSSEFPQVNISTVYRTLELLEDLGLVTHTHFDDGVTQYHLAEAGPHQHLVCRGCGSQQELGVELLEPLGQLLRQRYGFAADLTHFAIVGLCRTCVARTVYHGDTESRSPLRKSSP